jgi:hypothetical protein
VLLARGAAVGAAKNKGATPLSSACGEGHLKVARELLSRGVEVDTARNDGWTPLLVASEKGHLEMVRALLARGAAVDIAENGGFTPLQNRQLGGPLGGGSRALHGTPLATWRNFTVTPHSAPPCPTATTPCAGLGLSRTARTASPRGSTTWSAWTPPLRPRLMWTAKSGTRACTRWRRASKR